MSRKSQSSLLIERVANLLSERKLLRSLFPRYRVLVDLRSFTSERADREREIAELILCSPPFSSEERRYGVPQAAHLAEAALRMRASFTQVELRDNPGRVWDSFPLPGVDTTNWPQSIKERLIDLVGPLDSFLERTLSA